MGARTDLITGMLALLDAFIAANPTLLRRRFKVRPPTLVTDLPCAYIDLRPENIHYDNSIRDRRFNPSIVFVDRLTDNGETMDRFDTLIDAFVDFADAYAHLTGTGTTLNNVWSDAVVADELEQLGGDPPAPAAAARFTFQNVLFKEGRI